MKAKAIDCKRATYRWSRARQRSPYEDALRPGRGLAESIQHIQGVDAHCDMYHYDADGALIGVREQAYAIPCAMVVDQYGAECKTSADGGGLDCNESDAGFEPDAG